MINGMNGSVNSRIIGLPKIDGFRWFEVLKKATIKI